MSGHRYCVAPMMDLTDRHARYLLRLISRRAWLYTEMITTAALLRGDRDRLLAFSPAEHPVALQLGGAEPQELAECARLGEAAGYDEINLNVGCPSDRVQSGRFGVCLMAEPERVAECIAAMAAAVRIPVTLKTRIGIDRDESPDRLFRLVENCRAAGLGLVIVHARNAWLDGLSPAQNREIPPLRYGIVHELKRAWPDLEVIINGGIRGMAMIEAQLQAVDGVMLGREAYYNPLSLAEVDCRLYGESTSPPPSAQLVRRYAAYVASELARGTRLSVMTQPLLGLYQDRPGARAWRRTLSERGRLPGAGAEVIHAALAQVENAPAAPRVARDPAASTA
jgi:tRNA-dihydrouridine synthase A